MRLVPLYDGDEYLGSVPFTSNLDSWDGIRWCYEALGCHLGVGNLDGGRFYACYMSEWAEGVVRRKLDDGTYEILFRCEDDFGPNALAILIPEDEAKRLVLENQDSLYEELFGVKPDE